MNFNNYTTKSQETIQMAQQIAQGFGHNQIENEHIFKALLKLMKMYYLSFKKTKY